MFGSKKKDDTVTINGDVYIFIDNCCCDKCPEGTHLVWQINSSNQIFVPMALQLLVDKSPVVGLLQLLHSSDNSVITGATFANILPTGFDGTVYTVTTDGTTNVTVTPVAVGSQQLSISADVTYTDANVGVTTVNKGFIVMVNVVAEPQLEATTLTVVFGPQS